MPAELWRPIVQKAGIEAHVFMPENTPDIFKEECKFYEAKLELVMGNISDCAKAIADRNEEWFNISTLKEPYRVEGKKTMAYEIAEQLNWELPDVIVYPTGGGTGLIGMWKAFDEMEELGWIGSGRPRMVCVQAENCKPLVNAFHQNKKEAHFFENASTLANGLCVPKAFADHLILDVLYESRGTAIAVTDMEMIRGVKQIAEDEGIFACPEGGALVIAIEKLVNTGWIEPGEQIVMINTGTGQKYIDSIQMAD